MNVILLKMPPFSSSLGLSTFENDPHGSHLIRAHLQLYGRLLCLFWHIGRRAVCAKLRTVTSSAVKWGYKG